MASDHHDRVRERAYHLWRESGGSSGRDMEHWLEAERELGSPTQPAAKAARAGKAAGADKPSPAKAAAAKPAATKRGSPGGAKDKAPAKPRAPKTPK